MLKSCNKKFAASIITAATFTCLVVLLVAAPHQRVQVEEKPNGRDGMRSLQSLENFGTVNSSPADESQDNSKPGQANGFSAYFTKLTRGRREVENPSQAKAATEAPPAEDINANDIFIAVKTTKKFHQSRLDLLLDTWISRNMQQALSCKMAVEYDKFIESGKKWFCHVDDDNYVNVRTLVKLLSHYPHTQDVYIGKPSLDRPIEATERLGDNKMRPVNFWFATGGAGFCVSRGLALKMSPWASGGHFMNTAEKIRLPDDCTIGYIIESVLGVRLIRSNLFHSHLENLQQVPKSELHKQVTLSYGMFENKRNIIHMKGAFSVEEDPSRHPLVPLQRCLLMATASVSGILVPIRPRYLKGLRGTLVVCRGEAGTDQLNGKGLSALS
ncbi:hypothetical protein JZ751_026172, partial [Albula glossodonta]